MLGIVAMLVDAKEISECVDEVHDHKTEHDVHQNSVQRLPRPHFARYAALALCAVLVGTCTMAMMRTDVISSLITSLPMEPPMKTSGVMQQELEQLARAAGGLPEDTIKAVLAALIMLGVVAMFVDAQELSEQAEEAHDDAGSTQVPRSVAWRVHWEHSTWQTLLVLCAILATVSIIMAASTSMAPSPVTQPPEPWVTPSPVQELEALAEAIYGAQGAQDLRDEVVKVALAALTMLGLAAMLIDAQETVEGTEDVQDPASKDEVLHTFVQWLPWPCSMLSSIIVLGALVGALVSSYCTAALATPLPQSLVTSPAAVLELEVLAGTSAAYSLQGEMVRAVVPALVILGLVAMLTDIQEISKGAEEAYEPEQVLKSIENETQSEEALIGAIGKDEAEVFYIGDDEDNDEGDCSATFRSPYTLPRVFCFCVVMGAALMTFTYAVSSVSSPFPELLAWKLKVLTEIVPGVPSAHGLHDEMIKLSLAALSMLGLVAMLVDAKEMSECGDSICESVVADITKKHAGLNDDQESKTETFYIGDDEDNVGGRFSAASFPCCTSHAILVICSFLSAVSIMGVACAHMGLSAATSPPELSVMSSSVQELMAFTGAVHDATSDEMVKLALAAFAMLGVAAALVDVKEIAEEVEKVDGCASQAEASQSCMPHILSSCLAFRAVLGAVSLVTVSCSYVALCPAMSSPEFLVTQTVVAHELDALAGIMRSAVPDEMVKLALAAFALLGLVAALVDIHDISEDSEEICEPARENEVSHTLERRYPWPCPTFPAGLRLCTFLGAAAIAIPMFTYVVSLSFAPSVPGHLVAPPTAIWELEMLAGTMQSAYGTNGLADETTKLGFVALAMIGVVAMLLDAQEISEDFEEVQEPVSKDVSQRLTTYIPWPCSTSSVLYAVLSTVLVLAAISLCAMSSPITPVPTMHPVVSSTAVQELEVLAGVVHSLPDESTKVVLAALAMFGIAAALADAHEVAHDVQEEETCEKVCEPGTEETKAPWSALWRAAHPCSLLRAIPAC